jgi:hypothetical protein
MGVGESAEEIGVWPKRRGSPRRSWRCGASSMGSHQLLQRVALLGRNRHRLTSGTDRFAEVFFNFNFDKVYQLAAARRSGGRFRARS